MPEVVRGHQVVAQAGRDVQDIPPACPSASLYARPHFAQPVLDHAAERSAGPGREGPRLAQKIVVQP